MGASREGFWTAFWSGQSSHGPLISQLTLCVAVRPAGPRERCLPSSEKQVEVLQWRVVGGGSRVAQQAGTVGESRPYRNPVPEEQT